MNNQSTNIFKKYPVTAFYILVFFISWLGWGAQTLHSYGLFPFDHPLFTFLGAGGPTLAAVIVIWVIKGKNGPSELFSPLFKWRVSWGWFAFVFLFWFAVAALALGFGSLLGQKFPDIGGFSWPLIFPILITMLLSNVWEEIGWRGFALPRLQERYPDLNIVILMGILWSLWHLPLLLDPNSPMSDLPWLAEIVFSLALTTIYTWLYNNTDRSLLLVSIFHAMSNTIAFVLLELGAFTSSYILVVSITAIFAIAIVLFYGAKKFRKK
jgi:membrane protease YdiL (CAAX protease family)